METPVILFCFDENGLHTIEILKMRKISVGCTLHLMKPLFPHWKEPTRLIRLVIRGLGRISLRSLLNWIRQVVRHGNQMLFRPHM